MNKALFMASATLFALTVSASAQGFGPQFGPQSGRNNQAGNPQNRGGQAGGRNNGTLQLPENIRSVVSIDAYNVLLAEVETDGKVDYAPIVVKHVYSGGMARLFGGGSVPTQLFVSPGNTGGGMMGGGMNGGGMMGGMNGGMGMGSMNGGIGGGMNSGFGGGMNSGFGGGMNSGFGGGMNSGFGGGMNSGFGGGIGSFQMRPMGRN